MTEFFVFVDILVYYSEPYGGSFEDRGLFIRKHLIASFWYS